MSRIFFLPCLCLLSLVLSGCFSEYTEHYFSEHTILSGSARVDVPNFLSGNIIVLPDVNARDKLLGLMNQSKKRIYIEMYTWTEKVFLDAIIDAKKRGVEIKVVLEGNVYGTPTINKPIFERLKGADIDVVYADNYRYRFTHAKFFLIDDIYILSTGNLTKSFFMKNRDVLFFGTDSVFVAFLEQLFRADFFHEAFSDLSRIPPNVLVSPLNSRQFLEKIIETTLTGSYLYVQTLTDPELIQQLELKVDQGKYIKVCVADNAENHEHLAKMKFPVAFSKKPYLHAKIIFQDEANVFIGSQNLTTTSLEKNREVGVYIKDNHILYRKLYHFFQNDCKF